MPWAPDYITKAELAAYVHADVDADDADLDLAVSGASRAVDRHCGRQFGLVAAAEARYYTAHWDSDRGQWVVPIDDLMMMTPVVNVDLDGDGTFSDAITLFDLLPRNAAAKGKPYEAIAVRAKSTVQPSATLDGVQVTDQFGWSAVPKAVKLTTKLQASRFFTRREAPFGIAGSPDAGSEMRLLAKVDPDLVVGLADFRKRAWSA